MLHQENCVHAKALRRMTSRYERLVHTLSLLCEIDRIATRDDPIEALAEKILRTIATGLAAQNCSMHLIHPERGILEMKAAWSPADEVTQGLPTTLRRPFRVGQGVIGNVARSGELVRIADAPTHPNFVPLPDSPVEVRSLLCCPVRADGQTAGVLNLSHSQPGFFTEEDEHVLSLLADRASTILMGHFMRQRLETSERHYRELAEQLEKSLKDKDILLREIHHRVKNNLQLISSMLDLQADACEGGAAAEALQSGRRRVRAMTIVHERLYQDKGVEKVDFEQYVASLADFFRGAYASSGTDIRFQVEARATSLGLDIAVPCGLILNELMANAVEHAFPDRREGAVSVVIEADDGELALTVSDNGCGLPPDIDIAHPQTLGLQLVQMLSRQIGGTLHAEADHGTQITVRLPSDTPQEPSR